MRRLYTHSFIFLHILLLLLLASFRVLLIICLQDVLLYRLRKVFFYSTNIRTVLHHFRWMPSNISLYFMYFSPLVSQLFGPYFFSFRSFSARINCSLRPLYIIDFSVIFALSLFSTASAIFSISEHDDNDFPHLTGLENEVWRVYKYLVCWIFVAIRRPNEREKQPTDKLLSTILHENIENTHTHTRARTLAICISMSNNETAENLSNRIMSTITTIIFFQTWETLKTLLH